MHPIHRIFPAVRAYNDIQRRLLTMCETTTAKICLLSLTGMLVCVSFMQEVSGSELLFLLLLQDSPTNNFSGLSSNEWNFTTLV